MRADGGVDFFPLAWQGSSVHQKQEVAAAFFPEGLRWGHERGYFEPRNTVIIEMLYRFLEDPSNDGAARGAALNQIVHARAVLQRYFVR